MWPSQNDNVYSRKYSFNCSVTAKLQKGIMMTLRQNVRIGICKGTAMEKAMIWETKALEFEAEYDILTQAAVVCTLIDNGK